MEVPLTHSDRSYRALVLTNGLQVCLCSDPSNDRSGAALCVQAGQLHDPLPVPGLAHLTEHMVFMGSQKYPEENEYDSFVQTHGGHSNAYTDLEQTVFYFDVCKNLRGALDRLCSALSEPLFHVGSIERELNAVDSEHAGNVSQDHWRLHQLARTVWAHSHQHVYGSFGTGNKESLGRTDSTVLREKMVEFWDTHYFASNMHLVVLGRESLDELQGMVESLFSRLPTDKPAVPAVPKLPDTPSQTVLWNPVQPDSHTLTMQWLIPAQYHLYKSLPSNIVSHLLGHEGPGTLLYVLRQKQYAQSLSADGTSTHCQTFSLFTLTVELTELGLAHVREIFHVILWYIRNILGREVPHWIWDELQTTGATQFTFLAKRDAADTCSGIAAHMHQYEPPHYLSGGIKLYECDKGAVQELCTCLQRTDQNLMVFLGSSQYVTDQTDPWYGTNYTILSADHPDNLLSNTDTLEVANSDDWSSILKLPAPNDMLPTNFDLLESSFATADPPKCLEDTPVLRLWHKPDTNYATPKVNIMAVLRSSLGVTASPEASVLGTVWSEVVTELCNDFAYDASMAGLHCSVAHGSRGMEVQLSGYQDKAGVLLQKVCDTMVQKVPHMNDEFFERIRTKVQQYFQSALVSPPYQQGSMMVGLLLEASNRGSLQKRLEYLSNKNLLTRESVLAFSKQFLAQFRLELLVHGNVTAETAHSYAKIVLEAFPPVPPLRLEPLRAVQLTQPDSVYRTRGWNEQDENSCIVNLYQVGMVDVPTNAVLSLTVQLLREPAFNVLRTDEQLGYIVFASTKNVGECKHVMVLIQSDAHDPLYMNERIEAFLQTVRKQLMDMSREDFEENVDSLCKSLLETNKNLGQESGKHWEVIENQSYRFHKYREIATAVQTLQMTDVLQFYDRFLASESPYRRKLSIQLFGKAHETVFATTRESSSAADFDPDDFICQHPLFPGQRPVSMADFM